MCSGNTAIPPWRGLPLWYPTYITVISIRNVRYCFLVAGIAVFCCLLCQMLSDVWCKSVLLVEVIAKLAHEYFFCKTHLLHLWYASGMWMILGEPRGLHATVDLKFPSFSLPHCTTSAFLPEAASSASTLESSWKFSFTAEEMFSH